jgi:hypothetical protein
MEEGHRKTKPKKHTLKLSKHFSEAVLLNAAKNTINIKAEKVCENRSYFFYEIVYYDVNNLLELHRKLGYEESEYLQRLHFQKS